MSEYVAHEETIRGYTVRIIHDEMAGGDDDNPRKEENLGVLVCEHGRYDFGDTDVEEYKAAGRHFLQERGPGRGFAALARYLRVFHGATVVLPVYMYEHSGILIQAGSAFTDKWDSGMLGFTFDTPAGRDYTGVAAENIEKVLKVEVDTYNHHVNNDYWITEVLDADGDEIECVGGFLGDSDDALKCADEYVPDEHADDVAARKQRERDAERERLQKLLMSKNSAVVTEHFIADASLQQLRAHITKHYPA